MFEQCSRNTFVENSATHGGDGFFAFSGKEALGEVRPREDLAWYDRRGNCDNRVVGNDFSDAAAHGLELTFGFGNRILDNLLEDNAICGIWGGYSRDTAIVGNRLRRNGAMGYGAERGGINIEHGSGNWIVANEFTGNRCGIRLWWDEDPGLLALPWARRNEQGCSDNVIADNRFDGDEVAVELERTRGTRLAGNRMNAVGEELRADEASRDHLVHGPLTRDEVPPNPGIEALGETRPVGARPQLRGREHIRMTTWGPWDHVQPLLDSLADPGDGGGRSYLLLGSSAPPEVTVRVLGDVPGIAGPAPPLSVAVAPASGAGFEIRVIPAGPDLALPFELSVVAGEFEAVARGTAISSRWEVVVFPWTHDPREEPEAWRAEASETAARHAEVETLSLVFGMGGPADLLSLSGGSDRGPGPDSFGTRARTELHFAPGRWKVRTRSDDGIRVWIDDELLIDDWTWHAPREHDAEFRVDGPEAREVRVEHFELDGYAVLEVGFEALR
jgi:hypothetical protein